jgi:hypothetical protein
MRLIPVLLILAATARPADLFPSYSVVRYGNEFLQNGADARALALGEALAAGPANVSMGFYNPAALAGLEHATLEGMYSSILAGFVGHHYLGFAHPYGPHAAYAITVIISDDRNSPRTENLPRRDDGDGAPSVYDTLLSGPDGIVEPVLSRQNAIFGSFGTAITPKLLVGGSVKIINHRIDNLFAYGLGADLGVQYRLASELTLGLMGQDITTTIVRWRAGYNEVALPKLYGGVSYRIVSNYLYGSLRLCYQTKDLLMTEGGNGGYFGQQGNGERITPWSDPAVFFLGSSWGAEWSIENKVFVRAGTNSRYAVTFGMGLMLYNRVNVDYTFLWHQDLSESYSGENQRGHKVALGYSF